MPDTVLNLYTRAIPKRGTGTNAADAIQLALATMGKDAMHRLMLIWDGNQTAGNLEEALAMVEKINPKKTYLTHISHKLGLHTEVEAELPPSVQLAYDGLQLTL